MNHIESFDLQQIETLAGQGNLSAIATWLNYHLNPRGITVRVGWKDNCLGILLEASPFPEQAEMTAFMRQHFAHLKLASVKRIKVCGYQPGLSVPAWYEEIELAGELEPIADSVHFNDYVAPSLASWVNQGLEPQPSDPTVLSMLEPAIEPQRFLRFYITATEVALIALSSIQEIVKLSIAEVLPVPQMPDCVAGVYNWRGEMLWLVDISQQLGFASYLMQEQKWNPSSASLTALILKSEHRTIGILVPRLLDVESHHPQQIYPPTVGLFPAPLLPFMQGYLLSCTSPILNANALIHASLQAHCPH